MRSSESRHFFATLTPNSVVKADMLKILSAYAEVGENYRRSSYQVPPFVDFMTTVREFAPRFFEIHNRNPRTQLGNTSYNTWKKELVKLGLTMSEIRYTRKDPPSRHHWSATKPCQNRWCLCSEIKPSHPMKVCKGCWIVFYCSTSCQKVYAVLSTLRLLRLMVPN